MLTQLSIAISRAVNRFRPWNLFAGGQNGAWYDIGKYFTPPIDASGYHSTAGKYALLNDGRGKVNLLTYSQELGQWGQGDGSTASNTTVAPDGTTTMDTYTIGTSGTVPSSPGTVSLSAATQYTFSYYFNPAQTAAYHRVRISTAASSLSAFFNPSTLAFETVGAGFSGGTCEAAANGNYRVSIQYTPASGDEGSRTPSFAGVVADNSSTADTGETLILWGMMANQGTLASYQFTNDTVQGPGQSIGLELPGNRDGRGIVNLLPLSEEFENSGWTKGNATYNPANNLLLEAATTATHFLLENFLQKDADTFTGFVVVAKQSRRYLDLGFSGASNWSNTVQVKYDLDTNLIVNQGTGTSATGVVDLGDGTLLFYLTGTSINTTASGFTIAFNDDGTNRFPSYAGDATKGGYLYKAFVKRGTFGSFADYQKTGPYLGGPGEIWGQATSPARPTLAVYPRGGLLTGSATWAGFFTGDTGNYFSTPDSAALDITGDIEVIVHAAMTDWTPSSSQAFLGKWLATGNNRSFYVGVNSSGLPFIILSADGATTTTNISASTAPAVADGEDLWLKITVDADNGASNSDFKFYTSGDGESWAQLGTTQNAGATVSIFSGTGNLEIGGLVQGTSTILNGKIYRTIIKNGIGGTVVADFNPLDYGGSGNTWVSNGAGGETWTRNGLAFLGSDDLVRTSAYQYEIPGVPSILTKYLDSADFQSLGRPYLTPRQDGRGIVNLHKFTCRFTRADYWTNKGTSTIAASAVASPSGDGSTCGLLYSPNVTWDASFRDWGIYLTAGVEYTTSILVKAQGTATTFTIRMRDSTGTNSFFQATGVNSSGFTTCSVTFTPTVSGTFYTMLGALDGDGYAYIADVQTEVGSSRSTYQANSYVLGGSLGTCGFFCEPTQTWAVGGVFSGFTVSGTVFSKGGSTAGSRQLQIYIESDARFGVRVRGTNTYRTGAVTDGLWHSWLLVWDGTTLKLYFDNDAALTISVGTAVEEAINIAAFVMNASSPFGYYTGMGDTLLMRDTYMNAAEIAQWRNTINTEYGVA